MKIYKYNSTGMPTISLVNQLGGPTLKCITFTVATTQIRIQIQINIPIPIAIAIVVLLGWKGMYMYPLLKTMAVHKGTQAPCSPAPRIFAVWP